MWNQVSTFSPFQFQGTEHIAGKFGISYSIKQSCLVFLYSLKDHLLKNRIYKYLGIFLITLLSNFNCKLFIFRSLFALLSRDEGNPLCTALKCSQGRVNMSTSTDGNTAQRVSKSHFATFRVSGSKNGPYWVRLSSKRIQIWVQSNNVLHKPIFCQAWPQGPNSGQVGPRGKKFSLNRDHLPTLIAGHLLNYFSPNFRTWMTVQVTHVEDSSTNCCPYPGQNNDR